tara:strand:- start:1279 stop:1620 length:342 start_codon:yes stop_codon:yes gene_type:complete
MSNIKSRDILIIGIELLAAFIIATIFFLISRNSKNIEELPLIAIIFLLSLGAIIPMVTFIIFAYKRINEITDEINNLSNEQETIKENLKTNERLSNIESIIFHSEKIKKWQDE